MTSISILANILMTTLVMAWLAGLTMAGCHGRLFI